VDYWGVVKQTGRCGGYRDLSEDLWDQDENQILGGNFTFIENFSNYSTTTTDTIPESQKSTQNTANAPLTDLQAYSKAAPTCYGLNDHESFDQSFVVQIGGTNYPLTTVINWQRGNYSGAFKIDGTITVP
jgi:hypothetical protein